MTYRFQGIYSAIADPVRREIMDYLYQGKLSAGQLADKFDISRPAISKHLAILESTGLVVQHKEGRSRIYQINPSPLSEIMTWLQKYEKFWDDSLYNLKQLVEEAANNKKDNS